MSSRSATGTVLRSEGLLSLSLRHGLWSNLISFKLKTPAKHTHRAADVDAAGGVGLVTDKAINKELKANTC